MAFVSKNTLVGKEPVVEQPQQPIINQQQPPAPSSDLTFSEVEYLLKILGNADLKGHQVEMFYNLIVKLQNIYLQKAGKQ